MKLVFCLTWIVSVCAAQELIAPKDWNVEKQTERFVFQPSNLAAGRNVQIEIYDAEPLPENLQAWLTEQMRGHGASSSDLTACRPNRRKEDETSCVTKSGGGDQYWYAFRTLDKQARFAHVTMSPNTLSAMRYIRSTGRLLESAKANTARAGGEAPPAKTAVAPAAYPAQLPAPLPVSSPGVSYTVPVEGLYLHLEYIAGVGGAIYPSYEPYILLPDGAITDDLGYYPSSGADMSNWRRRKPRAWGRYTKNGSTLSIRWDDSRRKPEAWEKWFVAKAGTEGMRLSGRYQSIGGGGNTSLGGTVMVAAWSNYRFSPDGIVTSDQGSGGGTPNVSVLSQQAAKRAAYQISGYTIDLQYGDGHRERAWFFRFPDSDDAIGVGSKMLSRQK